LTGELFSLSLATLVTSAPFFLFFGYCFWSLFCSFSGSGS